MFWGLAPVFVTLCVVSLQLWHHVTGMLSGSAYGHVLRMKDPTQAEARLPFEITVGVAFMAVVALAAAGLFIEETGWRWVVATVVGGAAFFAVWSLLASISVFRHMRRHKFKRS